MGGNRRAFRGPGVAAVPGISDSERVVISEGSLRARKDSNVRPLASESQVEVAKGAKHCQGSFRSTAKKGKDTVADRGWPKWWPQIWRALTLSDDELSELFTLATHAKRWDLTRALSAQLVDEAPAAAEAETGIIDVAQFRRRKGDAE
jgi:hypothetical protein